MKKAFWILIFVLISFFSKALPQVSGYLSVKCLNGYTYQITFVDYVNSCDSSGKEVDTMRIWFSGYYSEVMNEVAASDSICSCQKEIIYQTTHTFIGPGTYYIWVNAGSRDYNVVNMLNSSFQDMYIYNVLTINPTIFVDSTNSPSQITNPPACSYGCPTQCYYYNPDAHISLGDSISYMLAKCLTEIGDVAAGYYVPQNVSVNSATGELSWCNPDSDGLYSFAIDIVSYQSITYLGNKIEIPFDTEEVELQVNVQNNCTLGINQEMNKSDAITVYPNPSNGVFALSCHSERSEESNPMIEVYNVLGAKVYSQFIVHSTSFIVNLSAQPNGVYLYRVTTQEGNLIGEGKVIIAH